MFVVTNSLNGAPAVWESKSDILSSTQKDRLGNKHYVPFFNIRTVAVAASTVVLAGIGTQLIELRMELISAHGAVDTALVEYLPGIMVPISESGTQ